ncbi:MAG: recombination mediator RecR [Erysipelotrichaceae bacterium]|nr:recombination mediator RecR [Erysipelotrichaceae bacterium]
MEKLKSLENLTNELKKLPSVGTKSAERMAYSLLDWDAEEIKNLCDALTQVKKKIHKCPKCGMLTENELCEVCASPNRDTTKLMVVCYQKDAIAFENSDSFNGLYHVLGGVLSIQNGVSYEDLGIDSLLHRVQNEDIKEVILATEPTLDGETTAQFIARLLEKYDVSISRLGYGLPMGGHLDYADSLTLSKSFEGRTKIK